ncbi:MAG: hypothetical protein Q9227_009319 [Pyrenula ochraceoflavens]
MSSFWPFSRTNTSPATFEKALKKLTGQIQTSTLSLTKTRTRARRTTALFTLYSTLFYLLYALICILVLGTQHCNLAHYAGLAGGPPGIWAIRKALKTFWEWRIRGGEGRLEELVREREETIRKLKEATRYSATEELIKKYGGDTPTKNGGEKTEKKQGTKRKIKSEPSPSMAAGQRTGIAPPATANISNRQQFSPQQSPSTAAIRPQPPTTPPTNYPYPSGPSPSESFAPNAFPPAPPTTLASTPHWYDRILDVLLGEDETQAKNRFALICERCRLVNGQAPPGIKGLEEVGRWRCGGCGAENGVDYRPRGRMEDAEGQTGRGLGLEDGDGEGVEKEELKIEAQREAEREEETLKEKMRRRAKAETDLPDDNENIKQEDEEEGEGFSSEEDEPAIDQHTPSSDERNENDEPLQNEKEQQSSKSNNKPKSKSQGKQPRQRVLRSGKTS